MIFHITWIVRDKHISAIVLWQAITPEAMEALIYDIVKSVSVRIISPSSFGKFLLFGAIWACSVH